MQKILCISGHNVGFKHDSMDTILSSTSGMCSCPDWHGCLMRQSIIGEEGIQPYKFSTCSKNQFLRWMKRSPGTAQCLLNKPNQVTFYSALWWGVFVRGRFQTCAPLEIVV